MEFKSVLRLISRFVVCFESMDFGGKERGDHILSRCFGSRDFDKVRQELSESNLATFVEIIDHLEPNWSEGTISF